MLKASVGDNRHLLGNQRAGPGVGRAGLRGFREGLYDGFNRPIPITHIGTPGVAPAEHPSHGSRDVRSSRGRRPVLPSMNLEAGRADWTPSPWDDKRPTRRTAAGSGRSPPEHP